MSRLMVVLISAQDFTVSGVVPLGEAPRELATLVGVAMFLGTTSSE
eukprot:CAMPEP_0169222780 /NCGR_PEP_ID=MMETSP1016-20121227/21778_1 /TAXON_ID=342587 /ORGANISM="Karlodinium micrum, Strain CCMP2283" /LENGTH=45 /DNA_ID= /DNA_START= /DNA_END= /DNA_ORIENTATION=